MPALPIKTRFNALGFQSFHAMAASRGDGLHPELVRLFERLTNGADANLAKTLQASNGCTLVRNLAAKDPARDRD